MPNRLQTLNNLPKGTRAIVRKISGGHSLNNRLLVLGFTIGSEVLVKQNPGFGPVIVFIRDSRIALGRGEAGKVFVDAIPKDR